VIEEDIAKIREILNKIEKMDYGIEKFKLWLDIYTIVMQNAIQEGDWILLEDKLKNR
jgi:hypothetical protein